MGDEIKTLQMGPCPNPTEAAVSFEITIGEVIGHYLQHGLSVSNAVGVLACVTSEITFSFNVRKGLIERAKQ